MKISLLFTGKTKINYLQEGIMEYHTRLKHYVKTEIITVPDLKNTRNMSPDEQARKEGELMIKKIPDPCFLILLDEKGKSLSSLSFATYLNKKVSQGKDICMATGGAYGFSEQVIRKADVKISLSAMTFSHQMVRLILLEQIYRAFTIIRNEPYHHS